MDSKTTGKRIRAVRAGLTRHNADSLVITKPANVTYLTGFSGSDSWAVLTRLGLYLLTDGRYIEQARAECRHCRIVERSGPISGCAAALITKLKSVQAVAVEKSITVAAFEALKSRIRGKIKTLAEVVESVRARKSAAEIKNIKKAADMACRALKTAAAYIKPGMSENELAGLLDLEFRKLQVTAGFEPIVAFGRNASRPHHRPGRTRLKKNDTVLVDFGVRWKGYCSDITRCFHLGKASNRYRQVWVVVEQAQAAAMKAIKAGVELREVDAAARKVISVNNLPDYGHGTGHGLGLEVHENPGITARAGRKLEAGMVVTIEPGVYIPGRLGIRVEDDVVVTPGGCRNLSRNCPHWSALSRWVGRGLTEANKML